MDELSASNDMKNLLDSTDIATLFLDRELASGAHFGATKIIKSSRRRRPAHHRPGLRPERPDAGGRRARRAADAGPVREAGAARDGRWFTVRNMPYRTLDDRLTAWSFTFADITAAKT